MDGSSLPDPSIVTGVQDLLARYAHRIDDRDFDGFGDLFTADTDYSLAGNRQQGRDAVKDFMRSVMVNPGGAHIITNVSVRGGSAGGFEVTADYLLTRRPEPEAPFAVIGVGRYDATVVDDGGSWRFARLVITPQ
jgi:3-phenylpropionate/cinnamic acid dioxygenase small subunit